MAEAVGLAVGVASFGIELCGGLIIYLDSLSERKDEIIALVSQTHLLEVVLGALRDTCLKYESNHSEAAKIASKCLLACEEDLNAVRNIMAKLCGHSIADPNLKQVLKEKAKQIVYPVRRPALDQVLNRLTRISQIVQSALQNLTLHMSLSTENSVNSLYKASLEAQANLALVKRQVEDMPHIDALSSQIASLQTDAQIAVTSSNQKLETLLQGFSRIETAINNLNLPSKIDEMNQREVVGRLMAKPSGLQALCREFPDSTSTYASSSLKKSGEFTCTCPRRHIRRGWYSRWEFLEFFDETGSMATHDATCRFANLQNYSVMRIFGIRSIMRTAVALSFEMRSGAGGFSISPQFTFRATVGPEAPAFRVISYLINYSYRWNMSSNQFCQLVEKIMNKLEHLFKSRQAVPTDINHRNLSLLHCAASNAQCWLHIHSTSSNSEEITAINKLGSFLQAWGVPAEQYDLYGCLSVSGFMRYVDWQQRETLLDNFYPRGDEIYPLHSKVDHYSGWLVNARNINQQMLAFQKSSKLAQVYECGPLSLAIVNGNYDEVDYLVNHFPNSLNELNTLGQTPFHFAVYSPSILKLLLRATRSTRRLSFYDNSGCLPLDYAIVLSGYTLCNYDVPGEHGCTCTASIRLLLEAGSPLIPSPALGQILRPPIERSPMMKSSLPRQASNHCTIYLASELRKRRENLKSLALNHLSLRDIEETGLRGPQILDAHASKVHQLLDTYGVRLPNSISADWLIFVNQQEFEEKLSGLKWEHMLRPKDEEMSSIFCHLNNGKDAGAFYEQDFRGLQDPMIQRAIMEGIPWPSYIVWLMEHDPCIDNKRILPAHNILSIIKHYMRNPEALLEAQEMEWLQKLYGYLLSSEPTDEPFCHCSLGGSNLFTSFWRLYLGHGNHNNTRTMTRFPVTLDLLTEIIHSMISLLTLLDEEVTREQFELLVRLLSFEALDLTHTCTLHSEHSTVSSSEPDEGEGFDQLEEKQKPIIKLLDEILAMLNEPSSKLWDDAATVCASVVCIFLKSEWIPAVTRVLDEYLESLGEIVEEDQGENGKSGAELGVTWESDDEDFIHPSSLSFDSWLREIEEVQ